MAEVLETLLDRFDQSRTYEIFKLFLSEKECETFNGSFCGRLCSSDNLKTATDCFNMAVAACLEGNKRLMKFLAKDLVGIYENFAPEMLIEYEKFMLVLDCCADFILPEVLDLKFEKFRDLVSRQMLWTSERKIIETVFAWLERHPSIAEEEKKDVMNTLQLGHLPETEVNEMIIDGVISECGFNTNLENVNLVVPRRGARILDHLNEKEPDTQRFLCIDLGAMYHINNIKFVLKRVTSYSIAVSSDMKEFVTIIDNSSFMCREKQDLHFDVTHTRYIQIMTPFKGLSMRSVEILFNTQPKQQLMGYRIPEGDAERNYKVNSKNLVVFSQPFAIDTISVRVKSCPCTEGNRKCHLYFKKTLLEENITKRLEKIEIEEENQEKIVAEHLTFDGICSKERSWGNCIFEIGAVGDVMIVSGEVEVVIETRGFDGTDFNK